MNKIKFYLSSALLWGTLIVNAASVITVTSVNDSGAGSLREAITVTTVADDTIRFSSDLQGATITLLSEIGITKNLVIDGGDNNVTLSGDNKVRIFKVQGVAFTDISNLTFRNGRAIIPITGQNNGGGAIFYTGSPVNSIRKFTNVKFINNSVFNDGIKGIYGGAIGANSGTDTFIIKDCTFRGNLVSLAPPSGTVFHSQRGGGAIYVSGKNARLEISNSLFEDNATPDGNGGAIIGAHITVTGSVFKNNTAKFYGGAIFHVQDGSKLKFLGNTFIGNHTEGFTADNKVRDGGVLGTWGDNSIVEFAANIFQDNTSGSSNEYNEFFYTESTVSILSGGYNVFKGAAVPASAANKWTSHATDIASDDDIVEAATSKLYSSSGYNFISAVEPLIDDVAWPVKDIFGNPVVLPYNAGADQTKWVTVDGAISARQPELYRTGVETYIGLSVPGTAPRQLQAIGFYVPSGLVFTNNSYTLKNNTVFTFSAATIVPSPNGAETYLRLTVDFAPLSAGEYVDTLTISVAGATDFVLPLRGVGVAYSVSPVALQNFGSVEVGNTSAVKTITVTGSPVSGTFSYTLKQGQTTVFPITEAAYTAATGGTLNIQFVPQSKGVIYHDTLVVSSTGTDLKYEVPLEGAAVPEPLYCLGSIIPLVKNMTNTGWGPTFSLIQNLYFTKEGEASHYHKTVNVLVDGGLASRKVFYDWTVNNPTIDLPQGQITSVKVEKLPASKFFGRNIYLFIDYNKDGEFSRDELVAYSYLDETDNFIEDGTDSAGSPVALPGNEFGQGGDPPGSGVAFYTLPSFTVPTNAPTQTTRLRVVTQVNSAEPCGNETIAADWGSIYDFLVNITASGGQTAIFQPATSATTVSVENGSIVVSQATLGSQVAVYNLQGQRIKTQAVHSNAEIIPTTGLARGVYIIVVGDKKWKIVL